MRSVVCFAVLAALLIGCSRSLFPAQEDLSSFFTLHRVHLDALGDLLQADVEIDEIWCFPGGVTAEAVGETKSFQLSGDKLAAYLPHCEGSNVNGAVMESYGPSIPFDVIADEGRYYRVDLARIESAEQQAVDCGLSEYLNSSGTCDVDLKGDWVIRYKWNSENDVEALYQ